MKAQDKITAVKLRKQGKSYSDILKKVDVSKSTISIWLRDIELTPKQKRKLLRGRDISRYKGAKVRQRKKVEVTHAIIEESKKEFGSLVNDKLFLSGLMLYWAEGDKHKEERVKFTNSDEKMILLMMRWFREICRVPEFKFRIALHLHDLHFRPNALQYWSKLTKIPNSQFQKIYIKNSSLRHRRNVLYNGTCAIVVNNKNLFRRILGWKLKMLEYFSITPRSSMDRTRNF